MYPVLVYDLEACPLNKSQLVSLDFVINRFFMKLFNMKKSKKVSNSHRKDMSPLTQGLNYRSACDKQHGNSQSLSRVFLI